MDNDKQWQLVRYHNGDQFQILVVRPAGHKWYHAAVIDVPVRLVQLALTEGKYMQVLSTEAKEIKRAARSMLRAGRSLGMTEGARQLLKEAGQ